MPDEKKKKTAPEYDLSIGSFAKDLLPKNPFTPKMTTILVAGFMMVYLCWIWVPPVLFFVFMILVYNLGVWCMKSLKRGLQSFENFFEDDES